MQTPDWLVQIQTLIVLAFVQVVAQVEEDMQRAAISSPSPSSSSSTFLSPATSHGGQPYSQTLPQRSLYSLLHHLHTLSITPH